MYSEEDLIKEEEKKKEEEKRKRVNTFLGSSSNRKVKQKEEEFYDDFFNYEKDYSDFDIEKEPDLETKDIKESRGSKVIIVILILVLIVVGILFVKSYSNKEQKVKEKEAVARIEEVNVTINEGEEYKLKYSFENFSDDPKVNFVSADTSILTVNKEGVIIGLKAGNTKVIMSYFIKGISYQKEFIITVNEVKKEEPQESPKEETPTTPTPTKDTTKPTLSISLVDAKENTYVNHDVVINVIASDNSGKVTTKYVVNCSNNCNYQNVTGGKITISSVGTSIVSIVATDSTGNKVVKSVTIKIDKTKPTCSLKVSSDGTLTANVTDNLGLMEYYGYESSYSGTKTKSKTVTQAGTYSYYVKDTAGNTNTCSITVNNKTQYRSRTCDISHKTFTDWKIQKQEYVSSCGRYGKIESENAGNTWFRIRSDADASNCRGSSTCYYCTTYIRYINGCNWGNEAWGEYQDTPISASNIVQVEVSQRFY